MKVLLMTLGFISVVLCQERKVPTLDGRIVGGSDTTIENHPYQVSLQLLSSHACGGAIISDTWVITAAHCVDGVPIPSFLSVRAGSTYRGSGGQVYSVLSIITHPSFVSTTLDYDIALLKLSSPIFLANAQAIALPSPGAGPDEGATAVITGWGKLSETGNVADILQVVEVPVISQNDCRMAYSSDKVTERMFCAGLLNVGGKDACQGDSGGPLVVNGTLVGLVSWGEGCAQAQFPGVYTNLPVLRAWIAINSGI